VILIFYLLLLYYILSDAMRCTEPLMYDLSNPSVPLSRHSAIPPGSMGNWVKVPDQYSSIPKAPHWQSPMDPTGSSPTQDSTNAQVIQRIISERKSQPLPTFYPAQVNPTNPNPGSRVLSMSFQDPVRIFDPG